MIFSPTAVEGAWIVDPEPVDDERGFFARTFCGREFAIRHLAIVWVQSSISFNRRRGTVRGMHYQAPPHQETKLVRCTAGAIYDVVVDLREDSPTYGQHQAIELSAENRRQLYVPTGCAHGFQTLTDGAEITYLISAFHEPSAARGVRFDDPRLAIPWPLEPTVVSDRDRFWALLPR
jgi:dTDP-4-dehydrorhamnose 3,5-epimerase